MDGRNGDHQESLESMECNMLTENRGLCQNVLVKQKVYKIEVSTTSEGGTSRECLGLVES